MTEKQIIDKMEEMCIESCSPEMLEQWDDLKKYLISVRKELKEA